MRCPDSIHFKRECEAFRNSIQFLSCPSPLHMQQSNVYSKVQFQHFKLLSQTVRWFALLLLVVVLFGSIFVQCRVFVLTCSRKAECT